MTNYDRIRNMSVEEMAKFISDMQQTIESCDCCPAEKFCDENINRLGCSVNMMREWLESEGDAE